MAVTLPSPLDPATSGWHLTPRAWRASEVYRALRTAEARHVAELVLFDMPRFQDETHYFGGKAFVIRRGQLFAAEETIAELAGTSRKVVRTGLRTLITAGLITRERVHPSGQCPHVITVRDYELSQTLPGNGANDTANEGPETGQRGASDRAPSKPQEPQGTASTAGTLSLVAEAPASDDAGPFARVAEVWNRVCVPVGFAKARGTPQQRRAAQTRMREPGWLEAFSAACAYAAQEPFYRGASSSGWVLTLGWLLKPGNAEKTAERAATRKATASPRDIRVGHSEPASVERFASDGWGEIDMKTGEPKLNDGWLASLSPGVRAEVQAEWAAAREAAQGRDRGRQLAERRDRLMERFAPPDLEPGGPPCG